MFFVRSVVFLVVIATCISLLGQERATQSQRDPILLDVLTRTVNVAGGAQAVMAVHDLTESGEITFNWGQGVKGPVKIRTLGGNHFRMEADLPRGRTTWVVTDGNGTRKESSQKAVAISSDNAVNLGNLTFPIAHIVAALGDPKTDISLVGIEEKDGRSIYRLRVKGQLGLSSKPIPSPVVKDLLIDALNFSILSVEDRPFHAHSSTVTGTLAGKPSESAGRLFDKPSRPEDKFPDKPARTIDFGDFHVVNGVLVPFSISTKLMGQQTLSIHLTSVAFNSNLSPADFKD